ncbi:MAG: phage tail sheath subtilisin-like domain-containing protein [Lachnospiraceae bacterium]|nr:phage tail sheath family protein [Lachnospiraceae bacterium]MCR5425229.1 phage tail sheath subtilisin-like domain-containing protein [Lachnospiraceae bacterium]
MAEYLSPGVYVEEYDNSPRSIEGVGTSTAGFVGLAEKGPISGVPQLVTSFKSFRSQFGGFLSEFAYGEYRYLAHSVEQFFSNGGTRCFVMRVAPPDAVPAKAQKGILTVEAANPGKWGEKVQITLNTVKKHRLQLLEKTDIGYKAKSLEGFREGDLVEFDGTYNRIKTIIDGTVVFEEDLPDAAVDPGMIPKKVLYLVTFDLGVRYADEAENYTELSLNPQSPKYIITKMTGSELVKIGIEADTEIGNPVEQILGEGNTSGAFLLEGGSDGSVSKVKATTFIGEDNGPGKRTGLQAFVENNTISMLAIPGVTMPDVIVALVAHCENLKNRFAVIDMPKDAYKTQDLIEYRGLIDSTYAAMYHPWIQVLDRATGKPDFVPPSGAVLGVYSRTDINRGVHKAPANETVFCSGLKVNYTKDEQDLLNPEGINLIRALPGQGIRVWGARTASSNAAFKYVNVRRLFIYVEESIRANTNWVVFEPNDAALWQRVSVSITSFLDGMWRNGMLAGSSASESYFVEIGPSTMTKDDIANGRLICNIGIAPSKPAEFVIFRVTQHTAEAGGGEE